VHSEELCVTSTDATITRPLPRQRPGFVEDFRRFFFRGLATVLPTLITLWLLVRLWDFLWDTIGQNVILVVPLMWKKLVEWQLLPEASGQSIDTYWSGDQLHTRIVGVVLAIVLVYIVGVAVGNFIGSTLWRLGEMAVMRVPLVRAIYPSVKQVTDFVLAERKKDQLLSGRVVAVEPHAKGIWSIGLVTGSGLRPLTESVGQDMVTVFVPSTPTAFTGYVIVVPRETVVELPLTVEEAMRLLVSGGVIEPGQIDSGRGRISIEGVQSSVVPAK
jgi:uncharacterized membrane protein